MPDKAIVFVDGQNLYHSVREAFGYTYSNYDILALAQKMAGQNKWDLAETRFYTGVPDPVDDPFWNNFWAQTQNAVKSSIILSNLTK